MMITEVSSEIRRHSGKRIEIWAVGGDSEETYWEAPLHLQEVKTITTSDGEIDLHVFGLKHQEDAPQDLSFDTERKIEALLVEGSGRFLLRLASIHTFEKSNVARLQFAKIAPDFMGRI